MAIAAWHAVIAFSLGPNGVSGGLRADLIILAQPRCSLIRSFLVFLVVGCMLLLSQFHLYSGHALAYVFEDNNSLS